MVPGAGNRYSLLAIAVLSGVLLANLQVEATAMGGVECEIRSEPHANGVDLFGVVWSETSVSGSYQFIVNKQGSSGSSHVLQRGMFSLEDGRPQIVGKISINTGDGDHYVVRLNVTANDQDVTCSAALDVQSL